MQDVLQELDDSCKILQVLARNKFLSSRERSNEALILLRFFLRLDFLPFPNLILHIFQKKTSWLISWLNEILDLVKFFQTSAPFLVYVIRELLIRFMHLMSKFINLHCRLYNKCVGFVFASLSLSALYVLRAPGSLSHHWKRLGYEPANRSLQVNSIYSSMLPFRWNRKPT